MKLNFKWRDGLVRKKLKGWEKEWFLSFNKWNEIFPKKKVKKDTFRAGNLCIFYEESNLEKLFLYKIQLHISTQKLNGGLPKCSILLLRLQKNSINVSPLKWRSDSQNLKNKSSHFLTLSFIRSFLFNVAPAKILSLCIYLWLFLFRFFFSHFSPSLLNLSLLTSLLSHLLSSSLVQYFFFLSHSRIIKFPSVLHIQWNSRPYIKSILAQYLNGTHFFTSLRLVFPHFQVTSIRVISSRLSIARSDSEKKFLMQAM